MVVVFSACLTVLVALAVDWDRLLTGRDADLATLLPCGETVGSRWENTVGTITWDVQVPVTRSSDAPFGLRWKR
jgi:hypothetical protein